MPSRNGSKKLKEVFAFHVSRDRGTVRNPEGASPIRVGTTYEATGRLKMCSVGCHGSFTLLEAFRYRLPKPGRIVSFVKITGDVHVGNAKVMGRQRKVLAMITLPSYIPTEECEKIHDGHTEKCGKQIVKESFVSDLEKKLVDEYRRNKRRVDADDTLVKLAS